MPRPEDEERKAQKLPSSPDRPATPSGTPNPSETSADLNLQETGLHALRQRYDVLTELGRGGMGIVYKARDRETGDLVALKVLKPEIALRPELIERFKAELLLARRITHKNVCRTHELLRFGDTVAIAMEFIEGESLRGLLNRVEGLSVRHGLKVLRQIIAGLGEAHAQGVVHRDLKPENILIARQPTGTIKVMDFGIARSIEAGAMATGAIAGTPAYMSPEQAEGKPADARSDIYSLGLIMYEMFTGRPALRAESPMALALKQIHETPTPPREVEPHLPAFIGRAIEKCLEKNPKKRYQSAAELESALSERAETKVALALVEPEELPFHLSHWQRSDWWLVLAAVVGIAFFFPFFNRTSIAPRSQVTFDRGALRRICEEYAERLGAPHAGNPSMQLWWWGDHHDYVARHSGAQAALKLANNPIPYWVWVMDWPNGTEVVVDHGGSLVTVSRHFPAAPAIERGSPEAERQLAEKDIREFFGLDPSTLTLESANNLTRWGQPATWFTWLGPREYRGVKHQYNIWVYGAQTGAVSQTYQNPPGTNTNLLNEEGWQWLPGIVLGLGVLILGIFQRREVTLGARWHIAFIAFASFMGVYVGIVVTAPIGGVGQMLVAFLAGVANAFVGFFVLVALERAVRRIWPNKLTSFARVYGRQATSEPCGLAILRGTFIGLALLGIDFFLVWLGTTHLGMRLDSLVLQNDPPRSAMIGTGWSVAFVTVKEIYQAGTVALALSFLASFFVRLVRPRWLALGVAAGLTAAIIFSPMLNMGAVQPYPGKFAILFVECLLLTWAFSRFDLLTVLWAAFAFAFCWANYYLLVMFEPTGALEEWTAFVVFGLFVLAAAAIAFKSGLQATYRRVATAFE